MDHCGFSQSQSQRKSKISMYNAGLPGSWPCCSQVPSRRVTGSLMIIRSPDTHMEGHDTCFTSSGNNIGASWLDPALAITQSVRITPPCSWAVFSMLLDIRLWGRNSKIYTSRAHHPILVSFLYSALPMRQTIEYGNGLNMLVRIRGRMDQIIEGETNIYILRK